MLAFSPPIPKLKPTYMHIGKWVQKVYTLLVTTYTWDSHCAGDFVYCSV